MSVRFSENIQQTSTGGGAGGYGPPPPGGRGPFARGGAGGQTQFRGQEYKEFGMGSERKHEVFREIGEAVTRGEGMGGYLQVGLLSQQPKHRS